MSAIVANALTYDEEIFALEEADRATWQWEQAETLANDPAVLEYLEQIKIQSARQQGFRLRSEYPVNFPDAP